MNTITISPILLQSILAYLRSFLILYLPYRSHLATDFFTIVAITLASTAQEHTPFITAVEVLHLLLKSTLGDGIGDMNQEVWQELTAAYVDFSQNFSVSGRLQTLNDMPVRHWQFYSRTVMTGMLLVEVCVKRMNSN